MSCESVVLLFAAIIANAGETKQLLIIELHDQLWCFLDALASLDFKLSVSE